MTLPTNLPPQAERQNLARKHMESAKERHQEALAVASQRLVERNKRILAFYAEVGEVGANSSIQSDSDSDSASDSASASASGSGSDTDTDTDTDTNTYTNNECPDSNRTTQQHNNSRRLTS